MAYVWDSFETYRLDQKDLEKYLTKLFGEYDFFIKVSLQTLVTVMWTDCSV